MDKGGLMSILFLLLKNYWKHILICISIVLASYFIYNKIYDIGYRSAAVEYTKIIDEYKANQIKRIDTLVATSDQLVLQLLNNNKQRQIDFTNILSSIKNKPMYTIEQGVCKPSEDYINLFNESVNRANK